MDLKQAIRMTVDTGKVLMGSSSTKKNSLFGEAKLVIIASNCPTETRRDIVYYCKLSKIPVVFFEGSSIELGTVCGKPFPVAALTVIEEGNSSIMNMVERK